MEDLVAVSRSDSTELDRTEPRQAREVKATDDIKEFCEKLMLKDDFAKTLSLAPYTSRCSEIRGMRS